MNIIILSGNLCRSCDIHETSNGNYYAKNTLAVARNYKVNGEKATDFIDITAWGTQAEYLSKYGTKGARCEVKGRLESKKFTKKDGSNAISWEVVVEGVTVFVGGKVDTTEEDTELKKVEDDFNEELKNTPPITDNDIPF